MLFSGIDGKHHTSYNYSFHFQINILTLIPFLGLLPNAMWDGLETIGLFARQAHQWNNLPYWARCPIGEFAVGGK